ncbi:MAG TPA: hypothetical protein VF297_05775 [Pyrinomonadaceae bacterium]
MLIRTDIRPGDYRRAGFTPTERKTHDIWGAPHTEERYDLELS